MGRYSNIFNTLTHKNFEPSRPCLQGKRILDEDHDVGRQLCNSILNRIFGLPLPENIISAMGEYMVENLYQHTINDVDLCKVLNATEVRPFLERYSYENPDKAQIVWTYLQQAIENAILVVEGLQAEDVDERQRSTFETVTMLLVTSCFKPRAKSLIPLLVRLDNTQAFVPELISNIENLAERFDLASSVSIDTVQYFNFRDDEMM